MTQKELEYAEGITGDLVADDLRATLDRKSEKVGAKIRRAQMEKVPYMLVLGPKEVDAGTVAVRSRTDGDIGAMSPAELTDMLKKEEDSKGIPGQPT